MKEYYTQEYYGIHIHFHNVMIDNTQELISALKGELETQNMEQRIHSVLEKYYESTMFDYEEQMRPVRCLHPWRSVIHNPHVRTYAILRDLKEKERQLYEQLKALAEQKGIVISMPTKKMVAVQLASNYIDRYIADIANPTDELITDGMLRIKQFFSTRYSSYISLEDIDR